MRMPLPGAPYMKAPTLIKIPVRPAGWPRLRAGASRRRGGAGRGRELQAPATHNRGEIARILGIRKQSVHELMAKGRELLEAQRQRLGVVSLRERRRARLEAAGVADRRAS
jgi:hypothetical protein